jgi:putative component of toxin-antitoxin plasmid stabilization module
MPAFAGMTGLSAEYVNDVDSRYVNGVSLGMRVVRTDVFRRCLKKLNATKAEIDALEAAIVANPNAGDVIPGLGGIRKIRFGMGGKGKRGGGRAIYFLMMADETILMLSAYGKAEQEDLSAAQKSALLKFIDEVSR